MPVAPIVLRWMAQGKPRAFWPLAEKKEKVGMYRIFAPYSGRSFTSADTKIGSGCCRRKETASPEEFPEASRGTGEKQ